jgi:hypothetical protein
MNKRDDVEERRFDARRILPIAAIGASPTDCGLTPVLRSAPRRLSIVDILSLP